MATNIAKPFTNQNLHCAWFLSKLSQTFEKLRNPDKMDFYEFVNRRSRVQIPLSARFSDF